jgi:hypothetical protein
VNVSGEQVVLDDAPILGPEGRDDRVVVGVDQRVPTRGFAASQVWGAFCFDHRSGHAQPDGAVDRATATVFSGAVLNGDLVAEEPRRAGAGVGDQRLLLRQFQRQVVGEELSEAGLDLLGFGSGADEPQDGVVGIAHVSQSSIAGIVGILAR